MIGRRIAPLFLALALAAPVTSSAQPTSVTAPYAGPANATGCSATYAAPIGECHNAAYAFPDGTLRGIADVSGFRGMPLVAFQTGAFASAGMSMNYPIDEPVRALTITVDLSVLRASARRSGSSLGGFAFVDLMVFIDNTSDPIAPAMVPVVDDRIQNVTDRRLLQTVVLERSDGEEFSRSNYLLWVGLVARAGTPATGSASASFDAILNGFTIVPSAA